MFDNRWFEFTPAHVYENRVIQSRSADADVIADFAVSLPHAFSVGDAPSSKKPVKIKPGHEIMWLRDIIDDDVALLPHGEITEDRPGPRTWDDIYDIDDELMKRIMAALEPLVARRSKGKVDTWRKNAKALFTKAIGMGTKTVVPRENVEDPESPDFHDPALDMVPLTETEDGDQRVLDGFDPFSQTKAVDLARADDFLMTSGAWAWLSRDSYKWMIEAGMFNQSEFEEFCEIMEIPEKPIRFTYFSKFQPVLLFQGRNDPIIGAAYALMDHGIPFHCHAQKLEHIPQTMPNRGLIAARNYDEITELEDADQWSQGPFVITTIVDKEWAYAQMVSLLKVQAAAKAKWITEQEAKAGGLLKELGIK
jgi:hypothetical protein